ncbi:MAG: extracellular solute-binding protein [Pseudomonadota bacterium]
MTISRRDFGRLAFGATAVAGLPLAAQPTDGPSHGLSIFGDLKYPASFPHFDYADPKAPIGGEFSTGIGGFTFDSLNPYILKGNPERYMSLLPYFETLMEASADEADSYYGLLAESAEVPEDRLFARFTLRPEARFRDGSPVTAEDVVFSLNALREEGRPDYRVILKDITGVEAEDMLVVRFDFAADAPRQRLPILAAGLPVFSKAYYEGRDFAESTLEPPLNSGPLEIESVDSGRQIVYRRREDYWGWHLPVMKGRFNFDRYRFEYFRDRSAEFEGFKGGAYTFREEFWSKLWATAYTPETFPALARGEVVQDTIPNEVPSGTQGYWINTRREKFQDPRVREAIALCFDFEWSNRTLFFGLYNRTDSFFEGGPMQADGTISEGERIILERLSPEAQAALPSGIFEETAFVPMVNDGSGRIRRALRRAGRLLDDAGWTKAGEFRQNASGETLVVDFLEDSPSFERITAPYVKNLKRLGVDARLNLIDPAQTKRRQDAFDFDITTGRLATGLTPGTAIRSVFHSSFADANGSLNLTGTSNAAVDELVDKIIAASSREELTDTIRALDRILRAMHIWIPQWYKATHNLAYWDIYRRPAQKPRYARGVIDLWSIDAQKAALLSDKIGG